MIRPINSPNFVEVVQQPGAGKEEVVVGDELAAAVAADADGGKMSLVAKLDFGIN